MDVIDWLLDSDPAIRWQVLRDLTDAPDEEVASERAKVATQGWGARLLALRDADGQWDGGACFPAKFVWVEGAGQPWTSTSHTLELLREFGLDPTSKPAVETIALVSENSRWEHAGQRFFDGEVEECINGRLVLVGAYFGVDVTPVVEGLLGKQLEDGGWNCETENGSVRSSFHSTICVLEGLLEWERATGGTPDSRAARRRGEEYLLERRLHRRLGTGEPADPAWSAYSFPVRWRYDMLRGLDYFRRTGDAPDPRLDEALELLQAKRQPDSRWLLDTSYRGKVFFELEDVGQPSRWNTLRALRVLTWAGIDVAHGPS